MKPFLNARGDESGTLFALAPQYTNAQEALVNVNSRVRLRHVDSGRWLHCPSLGVASDQLQELDLAVHREAQVREPPIERSLPCVGRADDTTSPSWQVVDVYRFEEVSDVCTPVSTLVCVFLALLAK